MISNQYAVSFDKVDLYCNYEEMFRVKSHRNGRRKKSKLKGYENPIEIVFGTFQKVKDKVLVKTLG